MKTYRVRFLAAARDDLFELYDYIRAEAGARIAGSYIDRLEAACLSLATAAERGAKRDDLLPGIRTLGFERRVTIAFRVVGDEAQIVRIFYGGQDFERRLLSDLDS